MSKYNVTFKGKSYAIDKSLLSGAISGLTDTLHVLEEYVPETKMLAPGLYETGAIALYRQGDYDAASAMITKPWDELEAEGIIMVSPGPTLPDILPPLNEYGFYYGIPYSGNVSGITMSLTFNEDGSATVSYMDERMEIPAEATIYGDHSIDMTASMGAVLEVSSDGTQLAGGGVTFTLGSAHPPKGSVYVDHEVSLEGELVLPSDSSVTQIADNTFAYQQSLTEVLIPDNITSIGAFAFLYCEGLESLIIPDSVTSINWDSFDVQGYYAFASWCENLKNVVIGNGVTSIGEGAFYQCDSLTSITIPDSVTSIGTYAFNGCDSLTSINIPDSVTSIGHRAFVNCDKVIQKENGVSYVDKWVVDCYTSSTTFSLRAETVGICDLAFSNSSSSLTSFTIPASVARIGRNPFDGCNNLTTLTVQSGNTAYYMSGNCLIERASKNLVTGFVDSVIPTDGSVTSIGGNAFGNCRGLTSVTIPAGVTNIGYRAFYCCTGLTSITIPASVTTIGADAFYLCRNLTSIIFEGTIAQWRALSKGAEWNEVVPATYVQCSDGQVAL